MAISIKMKKIAEIEGFNPREFCVKPSYWGYDYVSVYKAKELVVQATELAKAIDGICIAVIEDDLGTYVLGEPCTKGCSSKFLLFNAVECGRTGAQVRAITFNTGRGALTRYWYDEWIRYQPGSTV